MRLKIISILVLVLVITVQIQPAIAAEPAPSTKNIVIIPVNHLPITTIEVKTHIMGEKPDLKPLRQELKEYKEQYIRSTVLPMGFLIVSVLLL